MSLTDFISGKQGLDEVFIELAKKWDTLDTATQRYIATQAAGSRQQSRFLAMISDQKRLMELLNYANNAAGASEQQFLKTQDSLESKLNQLDNAWTVFTTNLANSDVIKGAVDVLTTLLEKLNKLFESANNLSSGLGTLLQIIATIAGSNVLSGLARGAGNVLKDFLSKPGEFAKEGKNLATALFTGMAKGVKSEFSTSIFTRSAKGIKEAFLKAFGRWSPIDGAGMVQTFGQIQTAATAAGTQGAAAMTATGVAAQGATLKLGATALAFAKFAIPIAAVAAAIYLIYRQATKAERALKEAREELEQYQTKQTDLEAEIAELENAESLNGEEQTRLSLLRKQLEIIKEQNRIKAKEVWDMQKDEKIETRNPIIYDYYGAAVWGEYDRFIANDPGAIEETRTEILSNFEERQKRIQDSINSNNAAMEQAQAKALAAQKDGDQDAVEEQLDFIERLEAANATLTIGLKELQGQRVTILREEIEGIRNGYLTMENDQEHFLLVYRNWIDAFSDDKGQQQWAENVAQAKGLTEPLEKAQAQLQKLANEGYSTDQLEYYINSNQDLKNLFAQLGTDVSAYAAEIVALTNAQENNLNIVKKLEQSYDAYIKQLSTTEDGISEIISLYKDFAKEGARSISSLNQLGDVQIGGTEEAPILMSTLASWQNYVSVLSTSTSTIDQVRDATELLTSQLIEQVNWIDMTAEKQQLLVNSLSNLGVTNAAEVVQRMTALADTQGEVIEYFAKTYSMDLRNFKSAEEAKASLAAEYTRLIVQYAEEEVKAQQWKTEQTVKALQKELDAEEKAAEEKAAIAGQLVGLRAQAELDATSTLAKYYEIDFKNFDEVQRKKTQELIAESKKRLQVILQESKATSGYYANLQNQVGVDVSSRYINEEDYQELSQQDKRNFARQQDGRYKLKSNTILPANAQGNISSTDRQVQALLNQIDVLEKAIKDVDTTKIDTYFANIEIPELGLNFDWDKLEEGLDDTAKAANEAAEKIAELIDRFHNLDDIINDVNDTLGDLQQEYSHLTSAADLVENIEAQISAYKDLISATKEEISLSQAIIKLRQEEAETLGYLNKYFTFSDNGSLRLTKAYYALRKKEDADVIEALNDWINNYNTLITKQDGLNNSLDDYHNSLVQLWEGWRDSFISLLNDYSKILEEEAQNELDQEKDKYDKLKELDDDYLKRLKKNIQARRDAREKDQSYQDLAQKQQRLNLLQRDTSGVYAAEIASLQEEISQSQQEISDQEVDEIVSKLEEEYEIQHDYWDKLLEAKEKDLNQAKDNGDYLHIAEEELRNNPEAVYEKIADYWSNTYSQTELSAKLEDLRVTVEEAKQFIASSIGNIATGEQYADSVDTAAGGGAPWDDSWDDLRNDVSTPSHDNPNGNKKPSSSSNPPQYVGTVTFDDGTVKNAYFKNNGEGVAYLDEDFKQTVANKAATEGKMAEVIDSFGRAWYVGPGIKAAANIDRNEMHDLLGNFMQYWAYKTSNPSQSKAAWNEVKGWVSKLGLSNSVLQWSESLVRKAWRAFFPDGKQYAKGGFVKYTGPAWVDGSRSNPEAFLSATDTKNIVALTEMLSRVNLGAGQTNIGDCTVYVQVDGGINSDYDIERAIQKVKTEILKSSAYRNVNLVSRAR